MSTETKQKLSTEKFNNCAYLSQNRNISFLINLNSNCGHVKIILMNSSKGNSPVRLLIDPKN